MCRAAEEHEDWKDEYENSCWNNQRCPLFKEKAFKVGLTYADVTLLINGLEALLDLYPQVHLTPDEIKERTHVLNLRDRLDFLGG
jgi:hypothetical protein